MNINELKLLEKENKLHGIFSNQDVDIETYHNNECPALSKSALDKFSKNPAEYYYRYVEPIIKDKETPQMRLGQAMHCALLEPEKFFNTYVDNSFALKLGSGQTKAHKEALEKFRFENPQKTIIDIDDMETIKGMLLALSKNIIAKNMLTCGKLEQSMFWRDEETGLLLKTRPDYLRDDNYIFDLKTTSDASFFEKSIADFRYYIQETFLRLGAKAIFKQDFKVLFLVIETKVPYGIRFIRLHSNAQIHGEKILRRELKEFKKCKDANNFPSYNVEGKQAIEVLDLPKWIYSKEEGLI